MSIYSFFMNNQTHVPADQKMHTYFGNMWTSFFILQHWALNIINFYKLF